MYAWIKECYTKGRIGGDQMIQDIAPHRLINHYDPAKRPSEDSYILIFRGRQPLLKHEDGKVSLPRAKDFTVKAVFEKAIYLLSVDEEDFFLLPEETYRAGAAGTGRAEPDEYAHSPENDVPSFVPECCEFMNIRSFRGKSIVSQEIFFALSTCSQLAAWYQNNRYCGRCAAPTVHSKTERALICPKCGRSIYPHIQPAVIIGVTNGDELLITRYSDRPLYIDALVAGFTEIGETLEQTVRREVMEEVGLKVKNIRYYKSQPWAVADDILSGFYCDVDGDPTVHIDPSELKTAVWTRREDIAGQPDNMSLTNEMMVTFREGREPK